MLELLEPQDPTPNPYLEITKKFREVFGDYDHVTTSEPVLEIIEPGIAWVVNGNHGPTLVSKNMLILDLDHNGSLAELNSLDPKDTLKKLERDLNDASLPSDSFRVYRTFAGHRLIHTKAVEGVAHAALRFGDPCGVDPRYLLALRIRKASHARLNPKRPEMRREFLDQDAGHGARRACRFIGTINDKGHIPCESVAAQIRFHDERTEALSDSEVFNPKELF